MRDNNVQILVLPKYLLNATFVPAGFPLRRSSLCLIMVIFSVARVLVLRIILVRLFSR